MRPAADGFCIEIVSISCSVALTIALGAVLFVYDDQSLPSWPLGITVCQAMAHCVLDTDTN